MKTDEILRSIHGVIRTQNYRLTKEEIERADKEILPFLEEVIAPNVKEEKVKVASCAIPIARRVVFPAVLRYYAIVQDNLPLLDFLLAEKYPFEKFGKTIPLYLLNKSLSSRFSEKEYLSIIKKEHGCIKRFMDSLFGVSEEEREHYIQEFVDLIREDPTLMAVGISHHEENNSFNLLTRRNFDLFDKDFFLQMNHNQREFLNNIYGRLEEKEAAKVIELFQKYPSYSSTAPLHAEFLKHFSVDELVNMSSKDQDLYFIAIHRNCVPRMKEILALKPDFTCPEGFIREEILRSLSNEVIVGLTEEGIRELSEIVIPELDDAVVFPIKKINKILFHDKLRKMERKIKEKIVHK